MKRLQIINAARQYVGTPFRHQGRSKKTGIDCIGLIVCVARDLGIDVKDDTSYPPEPSGYRLPRELRSQLKLRCSILVQPPGCGCKESLKMSVPTTSYQPGDVVLIRWLREPQHVGIVTDKGIIHSFQTRRRCVEHVLDDKWRKRIVEVYSFPGVKD